MGFSPVQEGQEKVMKHFFHKPTLVNCAMLITVTGTPGGGTLKLKAADPVGTYETSAISYAASAGTVQAALEALTPIGSGNVSVSGSAGGPWTATFQGALAATPISLMTLSNNSLTGGSSPSVTITSLAVGVGTIPQYYYIGLSQEDRATLGEDVTLATIQEITGTGYKRLPVKTNTSEWVALLSAGYWKVTSVVVTFTAAGSDWDEQKSIFITDVPTGNSGKVIDLRDITVITLANTQSQGYDNVVQWMATSP